MSYDTLIDAETWAFIHRTAEHYPEDAVGRSIAEQRAVYDGLCRAFHQGYPPGVVAEDGVAGGVPVRHYRGAQATVVYFHGGGFVVGGLDSHDDVCAEICARTGYAVTSVDYRLAPEHRHPAMFDDSLAATLAVRDETAGPLILAGDSAGGNLAAAVAHALRGRAEIAGQVLIYPALGGDMTRGSYLRHANAPMLTKADIDFYQGVRLDGPVPEGDATYAPLADVDFAGLPPTYVVTAQCDPLSDDGRDYRDAVLGAGGVAVWVEEPGLVHGYLRARVTVRRARDSFDRIVGAIALMGAGTADADRLAAL